MRPIFIKRTYFRPDDYRRTVAEIDYDRLHESGVDVLFIDIDNTLVPYDEVVPDAKTATLLSNLERRGFTIVLISNNHRPRVGTFAHAAGLPAVANARKPFRCGFLRAERLAGNPRRDRICVIGDQFMTDVLGGKRMGYRVIVVDAIKRKTEKWFTRINRKLEHQVLADLHEKDPVFFDAMHLGEKR
jgi:HAD superfamily phosphatase (TIGR01668 family)